MKKILSILFIGLLSLTSMAQTTPDTLLNVVNPQKVVITESPEGTRVSVTDADNATEESILIEYADGSTVTTSRSSSQTIFDFPGIPGGYSRRNTNHRNDWIMSTDGLCIGLTNADGQTGGGGLQWSKSFEISWLSILNFGYNFSRSRLTLGLGLDWCNYKTTLGGRWLEPDGEGGVKWGAAPEDAMRVRSSGLKVFSLQLPLMYTWSIPRTWLKLRMGPILNFNTYASLKGIYEDAGGNKCEYFTKDFDRRPVTLDLFGAISYRSALGVYVRYSPMKVLKDSSPVNFTPFTLGVTFFL